jgi:hypothetical protein
MCALLADKLVPMEYNYLFGIIVGITGVHVDMFLDYALK